MEDAFQLLQLEVFIEHPGPQRAFRGPGAIFFRGPLFTIFPQNFFPPNFFHRNISPETMTGAPQKNA
jgi:hypothetical protein